MYKKIILCFVLTVSLLLLLGENAFAKIYCKVGQTLLYDCPTHINLVISYEETPSCGCSNGTHVDCAYPQGLGLEFQGDCKKGTRQKRTATINAHNLPCPDKNSTTITVTPISSYSSWTSVQGTNHCPTECTSGQKQYQIVDCSEQVKTCCNGYWSDWGQSCAANGYLP